MQGTAPEPQVPGSQLPPQRRGWDFGHAAGAAGGGLVALVGVLMALAGIAIIALHASTRDDDGFYTSGTEELKSAGHAIATENLDLGNTTDEAPDDLLGTVRVRGESAGPQPVFIGIGPRDDVEAYLSGVEHSVLTDVDNPEYREVSGGAPEGRPSRQPFWAAQVEGSGEQVMEWDVEGGDWSVVFMNADGSSDVAVDASVGIQIDWLIWVGIGLAIIGIALAGGGIALIVIMRREANSPR
jgi:hypothetical protein